MKTNRFYLFALISLIGLSSSACQWWPEFGIPATQQPWGEFNPVRDMQEGPSYRDQKPGGMYYPAVHSQPVNYLFDNLQKDEFEKAKTLRNPVIMTEESVAYGKKMYNFTCVVCHGPDAKGHGNVIGPDKFNAVLPDLTGPKITALSDGQIYHVITHGYGIMYSYKSQLQPTERWAVINYLRSLQRAANPDAFKAAREKSAQEEKAAADAAIEAAKKEILAIQQAQGLLPADDNQNSESNTQPTNTPDNTDQNNPTNDNVAAGDVEHSNTQDDSDSKKSDTKSKHKTKKSKSSSKKAKKK